ncbi:16263_t:CDS:2, partial [Funneliformis caledonium]
MTNITEEVDRIENDFIELDENVNSIDPNDTNITELNNVKDITQKNNITQLTNNWHSPDGNQPCGHIMSIDGNTSNFIYHLTKHNIIHDTVEISQNIKNHKLQYKMVNNNPIKKDRLDKKY